MKKAKDRLRVYSLIFCVCLFALGVFLHFLYNLTGQNPLAGLIGAVNESTWEHMKIFFFAGVTVLIVEYLLYGKSFPSFLAVKTVALFIGLPVIPLLFYTVKGAFGNSPAFVNILIFLIAAAVSYGYAYCRLANNKGASGNAADTVSILLLCLAAALFIFFTYFPPSLPLFTDPTTGIAGIQR